MPRASRRLSRCIAKTNENSLHLPWLERWQLVRGTFICLGDGTTLGTVYSVQLFLSVVAACMQLTSKANSQTTTTATTAATTTTPATTTTTPATTTRRTTRTTRTTRRRTTTAATAATATTATATAATATTATATTTTTNLENSSCNCISKL